jgi:hypothetical protein
LRHFLQVEAEPVVILPRLNSTVQLLK